MLRVQIINFIVVLEESGGQITGAQPFELWFRALKLIEHCVQKVVVAGQNPEISQSLLYCLLTNQ